MLEVGRVAKSHGLRGEVIVELFTNRTERVAPGTVLTSEQGDLVVERSSPHGTRWIVAFKGVHSREAADELHGRVLSAPPLEDADALWVHELVGSEVHDINGAPIGRVAAVESNPASDLLVLENGGLIPLRFVNAHEPGRVTVDIPDGLLE